MKFGCSIGIFLNSANLICRSTDISKCLRGSLRLGDNESRLSFLVKGCKQEVTEAVPLCKTGKRHEGVSMQRRLVEEQDSC